MSTEAIDIPPVCFVEDIARILGMSVRTIARRRLHGSFPIPELPSLDRKPRWSGKDVREFIDNQVNMRGKLRRVG